MESTEKFTGRAEVYAKSRPAYPNEFLEYLIAAAQLNEKSIVADIGSGTGILSRQLLDKKLSVIAVEPNDEMRLKAEQALKHTPCFTSIKGTAENTFLNDHSVDAITAAQAFHWFDREKFKQECRRILKQDAKVALVWNSRDLSRDLNKESEKICKEFCPRFNGFSGGMDASPEIFSAFFKDGKYEYQEFRNDLVIDYDGFIGRYLSASYSPKMNEKEFAPFLSAMSDLFAKYSEEGKIILPNITRSYLGNV